MIVLAFVSCSKESLNEDLDVNIKSSEEVYLKNGRLVFQNEDAFNKHFDWIYENQSTPEVINEFNKQMGFTSMMEVYQSGMAIEDETAFTKYVENNSNAFFIAEVEGSSLYELGTPSTIHAYLSNANGIYQVGNEIRRLTEDYNLKLDASEEQSSLSVLEGDIKNMPKNIIAMTPTMPSNLKWGQYSYRTAYRSSKYRLVARLSYLHSDTRTIWEARSTTQRKRLGAWIRSNLSGDIGVKPRGLMVYTIYIPGSGNVTQNISLNKDVVGNWSNVSYAAAVLPDGATWNKSASHCSVTHIGASKTIVNSNIFTGYSK